MTEVNKGPLAGQRALVTGANSGIGAAVARGLAMAGAKVVINYVVNEPDAIKLVNEIEKSGGQAMALYADVSNESDVQSMFSRMIEAWGSIDILVNNAGIQRDAPFVDMTLSQWNKVMEVNLTGQFLCTREAAREFARRGVVPELSCAAGKVVCMSSVHEVIPWAGHVNYAASKGGVMMFMQSVAQELAHLKIRVNGIAPGAIRTPINRNAWETPEAEASLLKLIPYERIGEPADIAKATVWLASDQSDYVTGTTLFIDGGMTLYPGFREGG
ncbi:MAG: SDR family oxidoreductase [Candidatus Thiodiazotropha sp. (ex Lucinoma kastoroae)]|nr:SDR family oxidoreductase [Candidatus Thiodiazotropha sp. (ex Rostrolucina anterorostrata)]MCU7847293.1 SDR family oxidoreductase [Candidatus Thiodiazotropha sp. (ex Lucinoma kastoroae)]MCU7861742.1 SDR family oxidoreductase [Candidatus Thiodiazotropha sp. (ex Lucinoma kastoroae)]